MAFNKHEDGYAAVWKGKTEKAPATAVGEKCPSVVVSLLLGRGGVEGLQRMNFKKDYTKIGKVIT